MVKNTMTLNCTAFPPICTFCISPSTKGGSYASGVNKEGSQQRSAWAHVQCLHGWIGPILTFIVSGASLIVSVAHQSPIAHYSRLLLLPELHWFCSPGWDQGGLSDHSICFNTTCMYTCTCTRSSTSSQNEIDLKSLGIYNSISSHNNLLIYMYHCTSFLYSCKHLQSKFSYI